jgi:hypothetical protein
MNLGLLLFLLKGGIDAIANVAGAAAASGDAKPHNQEAFLF